MTKQTEYLGWSGACDRHGDPTGIAHAIVQHPDKPTTSNACGSRVQTYGMVTSTPKQATGVGIGDESSACLKCLGWVQRFKRKREGA